ncbi:hypothetical protein GCM10017566_24350 [Amycolatopsis bartoniae]|uniref:Uncharacterized protein n=1 Tax=Amycolatopsis bartoniae TaxID=941986 RepID=A0A8H9M4R4_9PSEU|nr:hypothetical protein GCM10017566_24350 [Amycolatopsis bartoniae]
MVVFLLGMAGALAPEIVRLYGIRHDPSRFRWSWFYLVVSLAFAGLGGLLALALPATTYWGAIYVGVSTPVLVNSLVRKGRETGRSELRGERRVRYSLVDSYLRGF